MEKITQKISDGSPSSEFLEFCKSRVYSHSDVSIKEQAEREQHLFHGMTVEEIMKMWFENNGKPSVWD